MFAYKEIRKWFANQLTTDYDVLIFFDQTNPSTLLPFR
jgi:hypothetical protein